MKGGDAMTTDHAQADKEVKPEVIEPVANGSGSPAVEGMAPVMPWPFEPEKSVLEQESNYYRAHLTRVG